MNRRHLIQSVLSLSFGAAACLMGAGPAVAAGIPDVPKTGTKMKVGQSLQYDEGLKVTFLAVKDDSRCPMNARCIWSGDAKVVLRVEAGNQAAKKVVLHTHLKPNKVVIPANILDPDTAGIPKSYVISLGRLTPEPLAGKKLLQSDYRAKIHISVAQ